ANPSATQKITTQAESAKSAESQAAYDAGVKAQGENKLDDAITSYKKAIELAPKEPSFYYALGTAYQAKNDLDTALANYKIAYGLNPREPAYKTVIKQVQQAKAAPLSQSAIDKQMKNDIPGAIADYRASLAIDDDPSTRMNFGTALQAANKPAEAVEEYKRAVAADAKTCVDAYYYMGTAYEALNKPPAAVAAYNQYLRIAPTGQNAKTCRDRVKLLAPAHR
ncbi:MAG: tetratricopeptide repeat protein, partial [Terriglobales bacterium]